MITKKFSNLSLKAELLSAIDHLGYTDMTPIQEQSLPHVLQGRDIIAQAATGSGKTTVFGLGILSCLDIRNQNIQALVMCPTRELAEQLTKDIKDLARFFNNFKIMSVCGGKALRTQISSLDKGVHVVVGTPGRIMDHFSRGTLNTKFLKVLVLDEADRMLDMGFSDVMNEVAKRIPQDRQTLLFSATYQNYIRSLSKSFQKKPLEVRVPSLHNAGKIEQTFFKVKNEEHRLRILNSSFHYYQPKRVVVFCNTKIQCQDLVHNLQKSSYKALAIHGDLEQREREKVLLMFSNGSLPILVATDVASRGLDIKDLDTVINYELPRDPEVYVHRIGRTGRAEKKGQALNFFIPKEQRRVEAIESFQKTPVLIKDAESISQEKPNSIKQIKSSMKTLQISGGKRKKLCKGDILGALTGVKSNIKGSDVGKIDVFESYSCVAVQSHLASKALKLLQEVKIKGLTFKVKIL